MAIQKANAQQLNVRQALDACVAKASQAASHLNNYEQQPRNIPIAQTQWSTRNYEDWTSGFWPGVLWYVYDYTRDRKWKAAADSFSAALKPLAFKKAMDHDLGFQLFCSYGNGYRLTKNAAYKKIILAAADTLATLFNQKVGTILSWPNKVQAYAAHNTIIDNMMNLELLFWASKNGGSKKLYDIAVTHAVTTMNNHFRPDHSAYHVVLYDTVSGKKIKGITAQGYSDGSMWARGQAWAIYGYTMCYKETGNTVFLDFAKKLASQYIDRLPNDLIPYWDFNVPDIPYAPKDASAAAIASSALLDMSVLVKDKAMANRYKTLAEQMLTKLSSSDYANNSTDAFLLHSTGHKPKNSEVDVPLIYADYYYIEALLRLKRINANKHGQ